LFKPAVCVLNTKVSKYIEDQEIVSEKATDNNDQEALVPGVKFSSVDNLRRLSIVKQKHGKPRASAFMKYNKMSMYPDGIRKINKKQLRSIYDLSVLSKNKPDGHFLQPIALQTMKRRGVMQQRSPIEAEMMNDSNEFVIIHKHISDSEFKPMIDLNKHLNKKQLYGNLSMVI